MRILHVNHSDQTGGAARAAYRLHKAICESTSAISSMLVQKASTGDPSVVGPQTKFEKFSAIARPQVAGLLTGLLRTGNTNLHSPALLPSRLRAKINASDADVVNLHWIGAETLSIEDVGRIDKPVVWTLHDMWAFCGAEHVTDDVRWRVGYTSGNRPSHERGFDLNRWTWLRKQRSWRSRLNIVTPSRWLASCVKGSALMRDWPVSVIPNPIDHERWRPVNQQLARDMLGIPEGAQVLVFGAMGGTSDVNKGFDLLTGALACLRGKVSDLNLAVFGQHAPKDPPQLGFPMRFMGHLHDDVSMRVLLSAADALAIPSRCENLPNTALEAMACGLPVVAFHTGGMSDLVDPNVNGYLASPFDVSDFANGLKQVLARFRRRPDLRAAITAKCVADYSPSAVAASYMNVYSDILRCRVP